MSSGGFLSSVAMFGSIFFITLFVQGVWGWKPLAAGLETMPWTGTITVTAPLAGALAGRIAARRVVVPGMAAQAVSLFWIGTAASAGSSYVSLLPPAFILGGLGMGLSSAPLSATIMIGMTATRQGEAPGVYNTMRELGGVFGIAVRHCNPCESNSRPCRSSGTQSRTLGQIDTRPNTSADGHS